MILGNNHDTDKGRPVTALATRVRRYPANFPGWGAPDAATTLLAIPEGLAGVITSVESHGSAPYTRYTVRFADGTRAAGLCIDADFAFADGNPGQTTGA